MGVRLDQFSIGSIGKCSIAMEQRGAEAAAGADIVGCRLAVPGIADKRRWRAGTGTLPSGDRIGQRGGVSTALAALPRRGRPAYMTAIRSTYALRRRDHAENEPAAPMLGRRNTVDERRIPGLDVCRAPCRLVGEQQAGRAASSMDHDCAANGPRETSCGRLGRAPRAFWMAAFRAWAMARDMAVCGWTLMRAITGRWHRRRQHPD